MINATLTFPYCDNTSILQAVTLCDECGWTVASIRLKASKSFTTNQLAVNIYKTVDQLDDPEDDDDAIEMLQDDMKDVANADDKVLDIVIGRATDFKASGNEI